ncbi:GNAT family N-acetyltransferase [Streptomyces johnsoniae]|uniref:GNAT family N-acetyltransferase n=1 Tax=Streptomyces johnsoniae TaxID=3075532 RepID=A0ABU2SA28_9ACTN|nr:GNAT family N-acetyltransferase [Streptomyces sp. DSM 41886]MDT0445821.1 GNAT family N-acetyltransferase [Streptomyces sp. DSM 41886]
MDHAAVLDLFDRSMRRGAVADAPGARVEHAGNVVRQVGVDAAAGAWEGVLWSDLDASTADADIAAQTAYAAALGREFEWKVYSHDRPRDLSDRLRAVGFVPEPPETLMVAETAALSAADEPPAGVRLRAVADEADIAALADVHDEAFGGALPPRLRLRLHAQLGAGAGAGAKAGAGAGAPAAGGTRTVAVLALADGRAVSAARMELVAGAPFAGLWGGGTAPEWRGRGIYRALVAYRASRAAALGHRYVYADASDLSRPILARLGFSPLSITTPHVLRPVGKDYPE